MTDHKHLKALIRFRMAKTGESYTTARLRLVGRPVTLTPATTIAAHDRHCMAVRFSLDGHHLLSGGFAGQARIWSVADGALAGELLGHTNSVNGIAVAGSAVVTVSSDKTVRLWDLDSRRQLMLFGTHAKGVNAVDLTADGTLAATVAHDGVVRLWNTADGSGAGAITIGGRLPAVACHPRLPWLAVTTVGPDVYVLTRDGERVTVLPGPGVGSTSVRWSPDGALLVVSGVEGVVQMWEVEGWQLARKIDLPGSGWAPVALSSDARLMAVGWAHHLGLWQADADDAQVVVEGLPKGIYALDISPDNDLVAMGGADGRVRVWRVS
jgi:WD40 repeat protein